MGNVDDEKEYQVDEEMDLGKSEGPELMIFGFPPRFFDRFSPSEGHSLHIFIIDKENM